mgnify:FL=1
MSRGIRWINNGEQSIELLDSVQRAAMERLDSGAGQLREECNQSNEYEQSSQSSESFKCDCDPGTNASCTCSRATSGTASYGSASSGTSTCGSAAGRHTSFPCAHCRDHDPRTSDLVSEYTDSASSSGASCGSSGWNNIEYTASSGAAREDTGARVWACDEPGNFKQANAESGDSIERRIGIPAGVTI